MKRIGVLLLIISSFAFCSERKSKATLFGDKYFEVEDYYLAAEYYEEALKEDPTNLYIEFQLAECERHFADYEKAQVLYKKVMDKGEEQYPLSKFYYAYMLKVNGDYYEAELVFKEFIQNQIEQHKVSEEYTSMSWLHYSGSVMALEELQKPYREYSFENVWQPVNSPESDFAPAFYIHDSMIVVTSARFNDVHEEVDGRLGGSYLDNYMYVKTAEDWELSSFSTELEALNTKFHEGASTFSRDLYEFYFTRCDEPLKKGAGYNCAIYVTEREGEGWAEPQKLNENINPKEQYNAQPALSAGGDTLFFISKRPGGKGMNDIWYSVKENGDWGPAVNLESVNTPYMEVSPNYYAPDHVLFFSSNGHESFGGLDVFMAKGENLDKIENVGLPFNSNKDDFYMVLGDSIGYLTSNRDGGLGHDDLYSFDIYYELSVLAEVNADSVPNADIIDIEGRIAKGSESSIDGLRIFALDEDGNLVAETITDGDGTFSLPGLDAEGIYVLHIDERGSITREADYTLAEIRVIGHSNDPLTGDSEDTKAISISGKLQDEQGNPLAGVEVVLIDAETGEELKRTTTNEKGEFVFSNLDPSRKYKVMVVDENGKLIEYDFKNNKTQVIQHTEDVNTNSLELAKSGRVSRVHFESIYFDFDSEKLRSVSKKVLDELVAFVKPHGHLKIEINGNTDAIGSEDYNIDLGKRRGIAAYNYLVNAGLDRSDIVVNSVGEKNPIADNKSENGRQLNRRVEFFIVGGGEYKPSAQVYVLNKKTSLKDVASQFHMSVEEVKRLNGIESDEELKAHQPLRVRSTGDADMTSTMINAPKKQEDAKTTSEAQNLKGRTEINGVVYGADDGSGYYVVLPKNTLYSISKKFNTTVDQIKNWNELKSNTIIIGQILRVKEEIKDNKPGEDHTALADAGISVKEHLGEVVLIGGKQRYVVKHGDTCYSIAKRFGLTTNKLVEMNGMDNYILYSGMILKVE